MSDPPPSDRSRLVCLILASGMGQRMGGPKALLLWAPGTTMVEAHVHARLAECHRIIVVTRDDVAARIRARRTRAKIIVSDESEAAGPAGSIAAAVASGAFDEPGIVVITPVDVPPVRTQTVESLVQAVIAGATAARPRFQNHGGHPIAIRAEYLIDVYARALRPPLRDVLRDLGAKCAEVEVDDPDVLVDLDTPDAFEKRTGRPPRFA